MTKKQLLDALVFEDYSVSLNGQDITYGLLARTLFEDVEWFFDEQEGDHEGDWYMAGKNQEGTYYFFTMAYGSCSYCDWLEEALDFGICDRQNIASIKTSLGKIIDSILKTKTFPDKASMLDYAKKFDWQSLCYDEDHYDEDYRNAFVGKLLSAIEAS